MKHLLQKRSLCLAVIVVAAAVSAASVSSQETQNWPREIETDGALIAIYQPQLESFTYDKLSARSAVMVRPKNGEPVFGAMWFDARVSTDRDARMVYLQSIEVTDVRFPEVTEEQTAKFRKIVEEAAGSDLSVSLDRVLAALDMVEKEKAVSENLRTDPPKIIFKTEPTVLVLIDGKPVLRDVDGSKYQYVVNTPFFVVQDPGSNACFLKGGDYWYTASAIEGEWRMTGDPPKDVVELAKKAFQGAAQEPEDSSQGEAPKIIVAFEPTELLQSDGKPEYAPVEGTNLLYLNNSDNDVIVDIASQLHYILISGRWYASKSLTDGPWTHVDPEKLPAEFANIPVDSDVASVRPSVPGTEEAREAVLDAQVPQTAEVSRKEATLKVEYDGEPKFEKIENAKISYAVNTDKSVLLIEGKYYCCDNAVWFVSAGPKGPWEVCVSVPQEVQEIPPSAPVYNVKYVYVYDSTPDVVYVGYTPGYTSCYVYRGCVVYGTGFYYRPYYGPYYYYPRPVTYGFSVHYNPWTGWGFSFGMSSGWFHMSFGAYPGYHPAWWGPAGYHYGYRHGYHNGYRRGYWQGYHQGANAGNRPTPRGGSARPAPSQNIYSKRDGVRSAGVTAATRPAAGRPASSPRPATADRGAGTAPGGARPSTMDRSAKPLGGSAPQARPNNVYADKNGNVYRGTDKGWEQRNKGGWSAVDSRNNSARPQTQQQLNRERDARQRGESRAQSYQQGRPPQKQQTPQRAPTRSPSKGGRR